LISPFGALIADTSQEGIRGQRIDREHRWDESGKKKQAADIHFFG
jgi:hypothetical protein